MVRCRPRRFRLFRCVAVRFMRRFRRRFAASCISVAAFLPFCFRSTRRLRSGNALAGPLRLLVPGQLRRAGQQLLQSRLHLQAERVRSALLASMAGALSQVGCSDVERAGPATTKRDG